MTESSSNGTYKHTSADRPFISERLLSLGNRTNWLITAGSVLFFIFATWLLRGKEIEYLLLASFFPVVAISFARGAMAGIFTSLLILLVTANIKEVYQITSQKQLLQLELLTVASICTSFIIGKLVKVLKAKTSAIKELDDILDGQTKLIAELKINDDFFRRIFDESKLGIYRTSMDGLILMANPAIVSTIKAPSAEYLRSMNLKDFIFGPHYDRNDFLAHLDKYGSVSALEEEWTCYDNSKCFLKETAWAVRDPETGNIQYIDGVLENITERKLIEQNILELNDKLNELNNDLSASNQDLNESEERYRILVESTGLAIVLIDKSASIQYFNSFFGRLTGYEDEEISQSDLNKFIYPEDSTKVSEWINSRLNAALDTTRIDFRLLNKDNTLFYVEAESALVRKDKAISGLRLYIWDVSDHWNALSMLRSYSERFNAMFGNVEFGIYRRTFDGKLLMANAYLLKLLSRMPSGLINRFKLERNEDVIEYMQSDFKKQLDETGRVIRYESIWKDNEGHKNKIVQSCWAIKNSDGFVEYFDGIIEDITNKNR